MFGIYLGTELTRWSSKTDEEKRVSRISEITLAPFLRQSKQLGSKWLIFLQESLPITYTNFKATSSVSGTTGKADGFGAGIRVVPGVSYKIGKSFVLESDINLVSLGLSYAKLEDIGTFKFESSVTTGITSYFGIRAAWYLEPK